MMIHILQICITFIEVIGFHSQAMHLTCQAMQQVQVPHLETCLVCNNSYIKMSRKYSWLNKRYPTNYFSSVQCRKRRTFTRSQFRRGKGGEGRPGWGGNAGGEYGEGSIRRKFLSSEFFWEEFHARSPLLFARTNEDQTVNVKRVYRVMRWAIYFLRCKKKKSDVWRRFFIGTCPIEVSAKGQSQGRI